ncbi:efflux RND transporter periplasmic adaptor subunit [Pleomorphomonas carboxyditropha]|uniref:Efflux transporter periplasmic adaptor subunit n=1 Tax=Pleomorphomonas carboxyditropha TaxID=2023338 RepID=A0A2G9X2A9_9HYPH|nr:efflux RND transporter periplasmic adaptor subunit [Pleomorphomonas carboxyditropha]PIP01100.1 efflux transporter periplasmic adaptor subunit [Pleomorphomonas carboxyditropha]
MTATPRQRKSRRGLILLVALVVAAAVGYFVKVRYYTTPAVTMMTASVARGSIEETVLATGQLRPVKLVAVGAQASGRITSLHVELGAQVKAGDLIAEIDSATQQNNLKTAEASLANIHAQRAEKEASLTLARQTLARQRDMASQNAVARADLESAEADVKTTEAQIASLDAQIESAEVEVETAKVNLGYTRITAPIDGTVLAIVSQAGQTVNASQSTPTIVVLGQLDTMTVRAEISEADIVHVKPGQKVYFTVIGDPEHRYDAALESIDPAPESIRSDAAIASSSSSSSSSTSSSSTSAIYYYGNFDVPNPDGSLRTYMTAEVNIVLGSAENVLTVPAAALGNRDRDGKYSVKVLNADGSTAERRVEIGLNDKVNAEVKSGLEEGDKVVTGEMTAAQRSASAASMRLGRGGGGPPPGM